MAEGAQRRISHSTSEVTWGTSPGGNFHIDRALAGAVGIVNRSQLMSEEFRSDRAIAAIRLGAKKARFTLPFELSYGSQEDLFYSGLCSQLAAAGSAITGLTTTVVAGTTNTMAATGIGGTGGTLVSVGDWVKVSGFTGGYTSNNGWFRVTARSADLITLGEAKDTSGTSVLTACSAQPNISVQRMAYWQSGTSAFSYTYEEAYTDINAYIAYNGMMVNRLSLNVTPDQIIKGSAEMLGKCVTGPAGTTYGGTPVAATTTEPMDANASTAAFRIDGTPVAICTALDLTLDNGMEDLWAVLQAAPYSIMKGRSRLSGNATLMLTGYSYLTKYLAETTVALGIRFMDPTGTNGYALDIPNVKFMVEGRDVAENNVLQRLQWHALRDSTLGLVNCRLHKLS